MRESGIKWNFSFKVVSNMVVRKDRKCKTLDHLKRKRKKMNNVIDSIGR